MSSERAAGLNWVKSSHSGPTGGNCVEVACLGRGRVAIRDSWRPAGPALAFSAPQWRAFTARAKSSRPAQDGLPG